MAIKYLDAKRLQGTNAERLALSDLAEVTTLGYTGSSETDNNISYLTYKRMDSLSEGDVITKIGVRLNTADTDIKVGVYSDNGGTDGTSGTSRPVNLLGTGELTGINFTDTDTWVDVPLSSTATVPASEKVWIAYVMKDPLNEYREAVTANIPNGIYCTDGDSSAPTDASGRSTNYANMMYSTANYGNGSGDQLAGHNWNIRVYVGTSTYPDLPNGTIFNETDAYKYFMWNGTDGWNQMVSS